MKAARWRSLFVALALNAGVSSAQNLVEHREPGKTAAPIELTEQQARECIDRVPDFGGTARSAEAKRIERKLNRHVAELLEGAPWKPFHHTLGISGYESYFNHPDELFYTLSMALPFLSPENRARTKRHLLRALEELPPYALEGYDKIQARPRESYLVPDHLRLGGRGKARSAFGVYAFWAFCQHTDEADLARRSWGAVKLRVQPLLEEGDYPFNIHTSDYSGDEAERLNGDLAGLIGFARLARMNSDTEAAARGVDAVRRLLQLRVNLERVNPKILEKTTASKSLHVSKLARYCSFVPEVADGVARWSDGCGAAQLSTFREARPGWHLAFGDRLIGGENYTNPLHFARALFAGAAFVEGLDAQRLLTCVDVPWCKGDLYFIEKCALGLWAADGRRWTDPATH